MAMPFPKGECSLKGVPRPIIKRGNLECRNQKEGRILFLELMDLQKVSFGSLLKNRSFVLGIMEGSPKWKKTP